MEYIVEILLSVLIILVLVLIVLTLKNTSGKQSNKLDNLAVSIKDENNILKDRIKDENAELRLKTAEYISSSNKDSLKDLNEWGNQFDFFEPVKISILIFKDFSS